MKIIGIIFLFACSVWVIRAEDWATIDGKTYKNVTVLSHDDGYVTILDDDGGAKIMLTNLPPALRARFGFDPTKASVCVAATTAQEKRDADALKKEVQQVEAARTAGLENTASQPGENEVANSQANEAGVAKQTLTDSERQQIQSQIQILQSDIDFMQGDIDKSHDHTSAGGNYVKGDSGTVNNLHIISHGAYADKIAVEKQQIADLKNELNGGSPPISPLPSTTGIDADHSGSFANVPRL